MLRLRGPEIALSVIQQFSWLDLTQPPGHVMPLGKEKGPLTGACTLQGAAGILPVETHLPAALWSGEKLGRDW